MKRFFRLALLACLALCAGSVARAQYSTGSIAGTVEDESGAVVPNATVVAVHVDTGTSRQVSTSAQGEFVLNSLQPGPYKLTVSAPGFKTQEIQHLVLTTGETLAVPPLKLVVGAVAQTVTAYANGAQVQTVTSERSELISSNQIQSLVVRGRNFTDLASLLPGVVSTVQSQSISTTPNINVNGARRTTNSFYVDGVVADDNDNGETMRNMISQDALSEVQVETSSYDAEYGRKGGSVILAVTKSGTQQFHGLLSYFNRNEDYNANNYFNNRNGVPRPIYRYNTVTYNIGGPIFIPHLFNVNRNKLFFFWNQEFWPTTNNETGELTVPTVLERQGNFSASYQPDGALYVVTDPFNGNKQFPNNTIPAGEVNSNGQALLNLFPLPNFSNAAVSKGDYNYVFSVPVKTPLGTQTLKIDYPINQSNTVSVSYNAFNQSSTGSDGATANSFTWPEMIDTYYSDTKGANARWQHIFTPNTLNEFHILYMQSPSAQTYANSQLPLIQRSTANFNLGQFFPASNPLNIIPNASFGGVPDDATIDVDTRFPLYDRYYAYTLVDDFSYSHGSHNFKAGVSYELFKRHDKVDLTNLVFNGSFNFENSKNNPLNTGYAYANAALGTFYSYEEASNAGWQDVIGRDLEGYVQDDWRVTPRLTLNLGVRGYYVPPFYDANNQISAFAFSQYNPASAVKLIEPETIGGKRVGVDPGTGTQYPAADIGAISPSVGNPSDGMVVASNHGPLPRGLTPSPGVQVAPRFGFAYDVYGNGKMAIRGGFGIFPNRNMAHTSEDNFYGQPPLGEVPISYYGQLSTYLSSAGLLFPTNVYGGDVAGHMATDMAYSLSVQQELGFGVVVDIAYVGSEGRHLQWAVDQNSEPLGADFLPANQDATSPGSPLPSSFYRPVIGYGSIYQLSNGANSNYNSLQVTAQRRFARNLDFGVAYTWSKTMDFADLDTATMTRVVPTRAYYYGLAGFDVPQNLEVNFLYDLPKVPGSSRIASTILDHWQFSGIGSFYSGEPSGITVTTTTAEDITGTTSVTPRAVVTGNVNLLRGQRSFSRYFNTSNVQLPAVGTWGNAPQNFVRGPGVNTWDLGLMKNVPFKRGINMQFRFEAYNALNHTQFSTIDTTADWNPATGAQTNLEFGQVTAAHDPRELQLSGRISF